MKIRRTGVAVALVTSAALLFSACSKSDDTSDGKSGDNAGISQDTAAVIAWDSPMFELNTNSSNGNATQNAVVNQMVNSGFNYYDSDLNLLPDKSFGTYELVENNPPVVKYTTAKDNVWSDGVAFDAVDVLLGWAAASAVFNNVEAVLDEEGEIVNKDEVAKNIYFDGTDPFVSLITATPVVTEDDKTITFTYSKPCVDWEYNFTNEFVPAHVVAMHALKISDPQEAKDKLKSLLLTAPKSLTAQQKQDLSAVAQFWNKGFEYESMPTDKSLAVSNGAYTIQDFKKDQYIILKANPKYKGERKAPIQTVTIRYIEDPMSQVTALKNGEVDLIGPQASADVRLALDALPNVNKRYGVEGTFEHVDLVFDNKGPFDPASYGGDAAKAKAVRKAFLTALPRQEIVDKLIKPLNPDAEIRNSHTVLPGTPNYDKMVKENGSADYPADADIDKAKALLAEAGVTAPVTVRFAYNNQNPRRVNELALIKASVEKAGFTITDAGKPATEWGTFLSTGQNSYDASLFGWQTTSTGVAESDANYRATPQRGINNYGHYSNPAVDKALDKLAGSTEPEEQYKLLLEVEQNLWADGFGTTIFQFPAIQAWSKKMSGVEPITISPTIFGGFWNWKIDAK